MKWKIRKQEGPYTRKYGFIISKDNVYAFPTFDHLWIYPYALIVSILAILKT